MNFFEVEVRAPGRRLLCDIGDAVLSVPRERGAGLAASAARRSSACGRWTSWCGAERDLAISGEVFLVEPIGPISYVDVDVGGRAVKAVADPDRAPGDRRAGQPRLRRGARASVRSGERSAALSRRTGEASMERVRMAVIGAGIWGENHAMALSTYPIVDLACICDLDARRAKALADKVGCDRTTDIEELAAQRHRRREHRDA